METLQKQEDLPIRDEQVITLFRNGGFNDPEAQALYSNWLAQLESARTEGSQYDLLTSVQRAKVYYKSGFVREAIEDLSETLEAIASENWREFPIEVYSLMSKMKDGLEV